MDEVIGSIDKEVICSNRLDGKYALLSSVREMYKTFRVDKIRPAGASYEKKMVEV